MKIPVHLCIGLSILVCLGWPVALFLSAFAFDAPSKGAIDEIGRNVGVLLLLVYPWGLVAGLIHFAKQRKEAGWKRSITCLLLMAPYLHLAVLYGVVRVLER